MCKNTNFVTIRPFPQAKLTENENKINKKVLKSQSSRLWQEIDHFDTNPVFQTPQIQYRSRNPSLKDQNKTTQFRSKTQWEKDKFTDTRAEFEANSPWIAIWVMINWYIFQVRE